MLEIPRKGFARSITAHNVRLDCLCDWIEGCITFSDDTLSLSDIVDNLHEDGIYRDQDFAKEHIGNAFLELSRRFHCLHQVSPYEISGTKLIRRKQWNEVPAFAFCMMLSLQLLYRDCFKTFRDYTDQGLLFEQLTIASLEQLGWATHSTAWSKNASKKFKERVEDLAEHLGEMSRADGVNIWADEEAKDGGLDVVCHLAFSDRWSGRPVLYVQCASGEHWKDKKVTPDLRLWEKLLDAATCPRRGIAIPFALLADDFRREANCDALSLLLDRHRLCSPRSTVDANWLPADLAKAINDWTAARIKVLPLA